MFWIVLCRCIQLHFISCVISTVQSTAAEEKKKKMSIQKSIEYAVIEDCVRILTGSNVAFRHCLDQAFYHNAVQNIYHAQIHAANGHDEQLPFVAPFPV